MQNGVRLIGVIADTHGLLRPEAVAALEGCDLVVHAGDIGRREVLEELGRLGPLVAVPGNNDREERARALPAAETFDAGGLRVHVLHDLNELEVDPAAEGIDLVIAGHTHRPRLEEREGVTYLNPGSAGPRRFRLPVAVARVRIQRGRPRAELVELPV